MEPKWMAWIRDHMPADLLKEYLSDRKAYERWVYYRISELETELEAEKTWIREQMEKK